MAQRLLPFFGIRKDEIGRVFAAFDIGDLYIHAEVEGDAGGAQSGIVDRPHQNQRR